MSARVLLLAIGKAAVPMARAAADNLKIKPSAVIVVRPESDRSTLPAGWLTFQAGHPLPTDQSLAAGQAIETALGRLAAGDRVIVLLSGGGSALLELPKTGIHLDDLRTVNRDLLRSGASIHEINVVRKSMSLIKAGGLARMAAPAPVIALILSDVVGDDLSVVASGPTVPAVPDPVEARRILRAYGLWQHYPERFRQALVTDTEIRTSLHMPLNLLLASNRSVQKAAAALARELGFVVEIVEEPLVGEAREAGRAFAQRLLAARPQCFCLIQGGETTVTVRGEGKGGRNQEFAVAAGRILEREGYAAIASFATDGIDGPTDAAGAIVSSDFLNHTQSLGEDPGDYLENNDVYPLLDRMGALIRTGPTQTNLNDIALGFRYRDR